MSRTNTSHQIKSWIDTLPTHLLTTPFPTSHPIYADAHCRLVVQGIIPATPAHYVLHVQIIDRNVIKLEMDRIPAWCMVPVDGSWDAEQIRAALKRTVET
ncbi:hypothetical protein EKO04_005902 [Ascochyta lentis]|uniref:Uncharacterized protein n=1 Tax=Ascochyta lentis TaxID=205686 RepID=A0A8H7MJS0_9PLEO|nr:hypothetical protein EKO04_005902 [Ascochyta lentis]